MLLIMFTLLDERKYLLNLCLTACILFGIIVLEKEVVKMSPIEWVLVMLILISSGVTLWTLIVDLERKVPDSYFLSDEKVKQLTLRL